MEHTFELTDNVPPTPHDSPLTGGYTPGSDEGRMKLDELITMCTKLSTQVPDLEKEKDAQAMEIVNLKRRVKKLERKRKSSISHPRRRKYRQVETSSDDDKDFEELDDHIENVEEETVDAAATRVSTVSAPVSTAGTLIKMKEQKAKEKGVAITDVEDSSRIVRPVRSATTLQPLPTIDPKDKELAELEIAQQERQRQEDDTNASLAKEFDEIQAKIDADHELAVRLTHEEQEKYTLEERSRLLAEFFDQRKKQLAAARLKNKTFEEIQRLYEKEKRWIDDFQPMDTKAIKDSEKKSEESIKKQKLEDVAEEQESTKSDKEAAADYEHEKEELRMWLTVVSDEEEIVDPMILSAKYPIVDWESQNLGNVDMEIYIQDLVDLYRLVMKRFEDTTPEGYNLLLWGDLKVMFKPNAEDEIWSNQQDWTLISWKLYESCRVHTLLMDGTLTCFNMLVEKRYPLIKKMLQKMLNWKLEAEVESTMAFELLKFIKS
ncbi:hypothetical protein Tco_0209383 [Tanacetum coccineum]